MFFERVYQVLFIRTDNDLGEAEFRLVMVQSVTCVMCVTRVLNVDNDGQVATPDSCLRYVGHVALSEPESIWVNISYSLRERARSRERRLRGECLITNTAGRGAREEPRRDNFLFSPL